MLEEICNSARAPDDALNYYFSVVSIKLYDFELWEHSQ